MPTTTPHSYTYTYTNTHTYAHNLTIHMCGGVWSPVCLFLFICVYHMWEKEIRERRMCGDIPQQADTQSGRMLVVWSWLICSLFLVNELILLPSLSLSFCLTHCPLLRLVFRLLDDISKSSWASFVRAAHNKRATLPSLGAIMVPLFWLLLLAKLPKLALFSGSDRCVIQEINNSQNGKYMPGVILQTTTFLIVFHFYCTFILKYSDFCIFSL